LALVFMVVQKGTSGSTGRDSSDVSAGAAASVISATADAVRVRANPWSSQENRRDANR
jgi:hypothetical protein